MMIRVASAAIHGVKASPVEIEVRAGRGKKYFSIIGLGDSAVKESRERVISSLRSCGFSVPPQVLVNLAPAEMKKEGSGFDLPIALAVLAASSQLSLSRRQKLFAFGELSLDGRLKPVRGAVSLSLLALQHGYDSCLVPFENYEEASLVRGIEVLPFRKLSDVLLYLRDGLISDEMDAEPESCSPQLPPLLSDVVGQELAKRALRIAACGGHNLLMIGPPGCGKSMLAERLPGLLPLLSESERLESAAISSIVGKIPHSLLLGERPYRSPHHVITDVGLIGGGSVPKPGEVSLAHNGVLFLDEFPEYRRQALEALRAPLESGKVRITRARGSEEFPASFQLIAAMNPCPCGKLGSPHACSCDRESVRRYLGKLSGPILDRIDMQIELDPVPLKELSRRVSVETREGSEESHKKERRAIAALHEVQMNRQGRFNKNLSLQTLLSEAYSLPSAIDLLEHFGEKQGISARGFTRVMRVARSIADIAGEAWILPEHVQEALSYRSLDRLRAYAEDLGARISPRSSTFLSKSSIVAR
ncbi:MAG: YifB family Mg chelatase-like AAA ATPase [Bdellovibrionales bacterium]|nr:YifB family Mg chelatase-like AAA ATPase [Bdellovibrionales bacterium]